jgi:hypothetical protein
MGISLVPWQAVDVGIIAAAQAQYQFAISNKRIA